MIQELKASNHLRCSELLKKILMIVSMFLWSESQILNNLHDYTRNVQTIEMTHNSLTPLPDFQNYRYKIAVVPANSKIIAWHKLQEAERRLEMYKWVEANNDPAQPQMRVLLNDMVSAFLLTFEATIQFLKDQFNKTPSNNFEAWLKQQREYDISLKGLRTLRNLEAHIENKPIPSTIYFSNISNSSRTWFLPNLGVVDLNKLQTKHLKPSELPKWNNMVSNSNVEFVFLNGIYNLKAIMISAEKAI